MYLIWIKDVIPCIMCLRLFFVYRMLNTFANVVDVVAAYFYMVCISFWGVGRFCPYGSFLKFDV